MEYAETPQEQAARMLGFDAEKLHATPASKVAGFVLQNFDFQKLGEMLAVSTLCDIIVDVPFGEDERESGLKLQQRALWLLTEVIGTHARRELTTEDASFIQDMLNVRGKTIEQVRESLG